MTRGVCTAVLGLVLCTTAIQADAPLSVDKSRVRCLSGGASRLLDDALRRSPTVQGMVERLADSDLIVYLELGRLEGSRIGRTQLMASSPGTRFVLVTIALVAPLVDLVARLGHELQHVLEIAGSRDVHDEDGMRALFRRIGWVSLRPDGFETDAAIEAGRRVLRDMEHRPRPTPEVASAR